MWGKEIDFLNQSFTMKIALRGIEMKEQLERKTEPVSEQEIGPAIEKKSEAVTEAVTEPKKLFSNVDLRKLIIPLIIEQLLVVMVGMADTIMISGVGEAAVSGVSLVDTVTVLLINVFTAMATGGAVVSGHYIGQKREERACKAADQLVLFTLVSSFVIMMVLLVAHQFILSHVFGRIDANVMENAKIYLLITGVSLPFLSVYNACAALFRAMGNSRISMMISLLMNVINITGNAILIYGAGIGVAGAAIATLISRIVASVVILVLLRQEKRQIHLSKKFEWRFNRHLVKKILHIGIPNGLENSMFQLGKILVLSLVTSFGTTAIAANAVCNSVGLFQILPGSALSLAVVTVVSQCVGAGDYGQVTYYTKKLMFLTHVFMVVTNLVVVLGCPLIVMAYNLTPETAKLTTEILIYHAVCCMVIWPSSFTLPNALRASNDVKFTMIVAIASMWVCRIGFSYVLAKFLGWGVFGVWVAMTIDWLCRAVCFVVRFARGKWKLQRI